MNFADLPMNQSNPSSRLSTAPVGGCLPERDGRQFSNLIQASRLAANSRANYYPNLTDPNHLVSAYGSQTGQIVLAHLSAVMYSHWEYAQNGSSVYDLAVRHLLEPYRDIFLLECAQWGSHRLNAPVGKTLYVLEDTPGGSIVADHSMNRFYKVLGLKKSPAAAINRIGVSLPAATRLTALPFRGVLVYDGVTYGSRPQAVFGLDADKLHRLYAEAQAVGNVITGFHVDISGSRRNTTSHFTVPRAMYDLSDEEKTQVEDMKAVPRTDEMVVLRRYGYTERDNPSHIVVMTTGGFSCGSFISAELVPSVKEVLCELVRFSNTYGTLPKTVAVDDKATAAATNEVTKHADIRTILAPSIEEEALLTCLPAAALEELKFFDGTPGMFHNAFNQCFIQ